MATKNGHNRFSPEDRYLADGHEVDESGFPRLYHLSSAFLLYCLPYPTSPKLPEFVYVPISEQAPFGERDRGLWAAMLDWNTAWEAAEYRSHVFPDLPPQLAWLTKVADRNIHLLPDGVPARYYGYAPLFHLLTRRTLEQNGLPLLRRGQWPYTIRFPRLEQLLPADFDARLARAFAAHIWPYLESGSPPSAFSDAYPLKLLAHNLDFWLPYAYAVAAERVRAFGRAPITEPEQAEAIQRARTGVPEGVAVDRPLRGGQVWVGEGEAQEAISELVELADANGSLRAIVDAIRSNRIADDFSDQWSYAKEDFERNLSVSCTASATR